VTAVEEIVMEFLEAQGIELRDLPPAKRATKLALSATNNYRQGRRP
jgi:ribonuclease VapC